MRTEELISRLRSGDRRALARALTLVENRRPETRDILSALYPGTGKAMVVGLTGPSGVGKSTLADRLAHRICKEGRRVAVLAVDPTSPFTGGALLGDRARMETGSRRPEIFIRSMATRGHLGGLAAAAFEAVTLLEASGRDFVLVETIGAGQDEVEIAGIAGVTLVVLAPGLGDEIQAGKAGLLEIADILVVNKADREGADRLAAELVSSWSGAPRPPKLVRTTAITGDGLEELLAEIRNLEGSPRSGPDARRRRFVDGWLREVVAQAMREEVAADVWEEAVQAVLTRTADPFAAAQRILSSMTGKERR